MIDQTRHALDFLPYMDGGLFSCEVKLVKPEPEIFSALLDRYPVIRPEESVFFDDSPINIKAADALGFHGIVFQDQAQAEEELEKIILEHN